MFIFFFLLTLIKQIHISINQGFQAWVYEFWISKLAQGQSAGDSEMATTLIQDTPFHKSSGYAQDNKTLPEMILDLHPHILLPVLLSLSLKVMQDRWTNPIFVKFNKNKTGPTSPSNLY